MLANLLVKPSDRHTHFEDCVLQSLRASAVEIIRLCYSFMGGVSGEAEEELVGKSRGYVDSMSCTSYASVSGTSEYWTRMTETEVVRWPFGSLGNVEKGKP